MRYYIISGEASGDLHGSNLIKALKVQDVNAEYRAWGGDMMQEAGATIVKHYKDLAFMGFVEVVMHLRTILRNLKFCKQDIADYKPDVLILIDYPGFNLRIAKWAKSQGLKVIYYISPQIWAWKENRVHQIKANVDKMLVILPFEKSFYQKHDFEVAYVGHPLVEVVQKKIDDLRVAALSEKPIIALLPGSRTQEIKVALPIMLTLVDKFPNYQFVIAQAPSQPEEIYRQIIGEENVLLVPGKTYDILQQAKAALVTSGTATLEAGLFGVPQIVCYKGNQLSYWVAKKLIKVKYIALVNLILDKMAVEELIQDSFHPANLETSLDALLNNPDVIDRIQTDYALLWEQLQVSRSASENAAQIIVKYLKEIGKS